MADFLTTHSKLLKKSFSLGNVFEEERRLFSLFYMCNFLCVFDMVITFHLLLYFKNPS